MVAWSNDRLPVYRTQLRLTDLRLLKVLATSSPLQFNTFCFSPHNIVYMQTTGYTRKNSAPIKFGQKWRDQKVGRGRMNRTSSLPQVAHAYISSGQERAPLGKQAGSIHLPTPPNYLLSDKFMVLDCTFQRLNACLFWQNSGNWSSVSNLQSAKSFIEFFRCTQKEIFMPAAAALNGG